MGYALELKNIDKRFPGVHALDNVNLSVKEGEIKGLVGENGAGKSTLIKIISGAHAPTSGKIVVFGKTYERLSPVISEQEGIAVVYQNLNLATKLSVMDNVMLGIEPSKLGFIDQRKKAKIVEDIFKRLDYPIDIKARVENLSAAQQGIVAIARALVRKARIFILDEPTAILTEKEIRTLFSIIKQLKKEGMTIIYISHRLDEVFELCDSVTVLRDGKKIGDREIKETSEDELISMMVGRGVNFDLYKERKIGEEVLKAENITNVKLKDVSLNVHKGEILGIYGLVGSGRTTLSRVLFGAEKIDKGKIIFHGKELHLKSPRMAIHEGVGLAPEDRRRHGLALKLDVKYNINLPLYEKITKLGFINLKKEKVEAFNIVKALSIKTPSLSQKVMNLSGGNQQKVVIGKWLATQSDIFILDEPLNGIDVGVKEDILNLINNLASRGSAIIFISSYIPELISICDRILVMRDGKVAGMVNRDSFSEENILSLAVKTRGKGVVVK